MFDFGVVELIESVPEEYQGFYIAGDGENEGKFVVDPKVKPLVDANLNLNKQIGKVTGDKTKASNESGKRRVALKVFEDLADELGVEGEDKAVALKAFIEDLTSKVKNGEEVKINMDKVKLDAEKRITEALEGKDNELSGMRSALSKHLIDDVATRAMAEVGVESIELLLPHVKSKSKVVENDGKFEVRVLDADGDARTDGKGGFMTVKDLITEMKNDKVYAPAFPSEENKGTGFEPGSSKKVTTTKKQEGELTSVEKIRVGLNKKQHADGTGRQLTV